METKATQSKGPDFCAPRGLGISMCYSDDPEMGAQHVSSCNLRLVHSTMQTKGTFRSPPNHKLLGSPSLARTQKWNPPRSTFGSTPLMFACYHKNVRIAELLLESEADPEAAEGSIDVMQWVVLEG